MKKGTVAAGENHDLKYPHREARGNAALEELFSEVKLLVSETYSNSGRTSENDK